MRRKDREMCREFALEVIDDSSFGTLSTIDTNGEPYCLPLSIVRDSVTDYLYFHSAQSGKKVDIFQQQSKVCISFVNYNQVPHLYSDSELDDMAKNPQQVGELTRKVFTTEFSSTIVFGKILLVDSSEEKAKALQLICEKYTPNQMKYFEAAIKSSLDKTAIYRIEIDDITSKRKKFNPQREELKWQAEE